MKWNSKPRNSVRGEMSFTRISWLKLYECRSVQMWGEHLQLYLEITQSNYYFKKGAVACIQTLVHNISICTSFSFRTVKAWYLTEEDWRINPRSVTSTEILFVITEPFWLHNDVTKLQKLWFVFRIPCQKYLNDCWNAKLFIRTRFLLLPVY